MPTTDPSETMAEVALLYELALAVSTSLELDTCCEAFVSTLMERKGLAFASVWLHAEEQRTVLAYAMPRKGHDTTTLPSDHPLFRRAQDGPTVLSAEAFDAMGVTRQMVAGTVALIPLDELGLLELHAPPGATTLHVLTLRQLAPVTAKFTASLRACIDHATLLGAVEAQRTMQGRLEHAARMEALGQLAGGIAHDFNNIMSAISAYAELMQLQPTDADKVSSYAERVLAACDRAGALTKQLLTFGPDHTMERQPIDLNHVVREVGALLERTLDDAIVLRVTESDTPAVVLGDAASLHAVALNLAVNAVDALPDGGHLQVSVLADPDTRTVVLEVVDDGLGMSEHTRRRLFDPFFTTKPQGKGTGLGLATAYGTVRAHGGRIEVESAPGEGARFRVVLPASSAMSVGPTARHEPVTVPAGLRVLVVDDEALPRRAAAEMLRQLGCEVAEASEGAEAIARYEAHRFDVVLLDMMMPGMDGAQVLQRLQAIDPDVRALMASAFGHARLAHDLRRHPPDGFLQKPYRLRSLATELQRVVQTIRAG